MSDIRYSLNREQPQHFLKLFLLIVVIFAAIEASIITHFPPVASWAAGAVMIALLIGTWLTGSGSTVLESAGIRIRWSPLPSRLYSWEEISAIVLKDSGTGLFGATRSLELRTKAGRRHRVAGLEDSPRRSDPELKAKLEEIRQAWKAHGVEHTH
ncbi:hypothetical protein GXW83_24125 [Streptacidiphilus sp. PB12-B1b]|uniref:hypothetical protein n=1 Tax=Streptacidiphilus sp. PB12-B1b TaxID=2705012 RepID=UPI0015FD7F50|nr:hypothetical protein [Streptacidiphilus sp. PB12-B1b]QMU78334.1 hypothetical protein GXW83_24125 [Streptacidiphilus sp. PB12-B1b]